MTKKLPTKQKPWLGWYFAQPDEKLRYGDNRKIKVGTTHKVDCQPVLCEIGLHASKSVLDACDYASSNILFRVELSGQIVDGYDKSSATARKYIVRIDIESVLFEFARKCALAVIHLWNCPPVVKEYLETGNENLKLAAWSAARAAAKKDQEKMLEKMVLAAIKKAPK